MQTGNYSYRYAVCIGDVTPCDPIVKAVIVRVMKSRKVLKHNLLIQEVLLLIQSLLPYV